MPSNALPPLFSNTNVDRGAQPVALGYIGASITVLACAIRLSLTIKKKHGFSSDDYFFLAGAFFAVAASVTLERAVGEGLGKHSDVLKLHHLDIYTKLAYSTSLLSVFAQSCAKLSVACLFERIAPRQDKRRIAILFGSICFWICFATFGTAFSCRGKVQWDANCTSGGNVQLPILVTNIITDAMLSFWMVPILWKLQAKARDRVIPILLMASRVLVCAAEIALLGWLAKSPTHIAFQGQDRTWTSTTGFTLEIAIVHLSIITATIPRINSFLADVQTRRAGLALTPRDYENYTSSKSDSNNASKGASKVRTSNPLSSYYGQSTQVHITSDARIKRGEEIELDVRDNVETGSQISLQRNAVYQKTEWNWTEEYTTDSNRL